MNDYWRNKYGRPRFCRTVNTLNKTVKIAEIVSSFHPSRIAVRVRHWTHILGSVILDPISMWYEWRTRTRLAGDHIMFLNGSVLWVQTSIYPCNVFPFTNSLEMSLLWHYWRSNYSEKFNLFLVTIFFHFFFYISFVRFSTIWIYMQGFPSEIFLIPKLWEKLPETHRMVSFCGTSFDLFEAWRSNRSKLGETIYNDA